MTTSQSDSHNHAQNDAHRVIELRRYTLHPGQRDALIDLFDAEFIETQEAVGISVVGQFRDEDHPDTFTWFRGFTDMDARKSALESFYGGPCWAEHRNAANATMIDSDNVLLLEPVHRRSFPEVERASTPPRNFTVVTFHLTVLASEQQSAELLRMIGPDTTVAVLVTLAAENTFPVLPVREGEHVVVVVSVAGAILSGTWEEIGNATFGSALVRAEVLRLTPTSRSRLR